MSIDIQELKSRLADAIALIKEFVRLSGKQTITANPTVPALAWVEAAHQEELIAAQKDALRQKATEFLASVEVTNE